MTYFVVSHVSHAWDRNTSYLKYFTVSQMHSKGVRAASRVVVELRNDGVKYTEIHWNTCAIRVSQHHTRNTLEYTGIHWNTLEYVEIPLLQEAEDGGAAAI